MNSSNNICYSSSSFYSNWSNRDSPETLFYITYMKRVGVHTFAGSSNAMKVYNWLEEIEQNFKLMKAPEKIKPEIIRLFVVDNAGEW